MKAAVVQEPGKLIVRDIPMPKPGPYDALCRLLYGATCSGTDQHLIAGRFPFPVSYPTILGHESIGQVVQLGSKVRNLSVGDLITRVGAPPIDTLAAHWGGFAEYGLAKDHWALKEDGLPASSWQPFRVNQVLPKTVDPRAATLMITWRETFSYITRMGIHAGDQVLVIGSGGNGLAFVAHAANKGAALVTMIGNAAREPLARAAGADAFIDYQAEDVVEQLAQLPPTDYVIDAVGKAGQIDLALPYLASGGTVGIYGIDEYYENAINPRLTSGSFSYYGEGYDEAEAHDAVLAFWEQGQLDPTIWLDLGHPFQLDEIQAAMDAVQQRRLVKALVEL
jgi:D-arabinose 1-dehydrogenase-like Zn-dependent alcohol dehydrogenase